MAQPLVKKDDDRDDEGNSFILVFSHSALFSDGRRRTTVCLHGSEFDLSCFRFVFEIRCSMLPQLDHSVSVLDLCLFVIFQLWMRDVHSYYYAWIENELDLHNFFFPLIGSGSWLCKRIWIDLMTLFAMQIIGLSYRFNLTNLEWRVVYFNLVASSFLFFTFGLTEGGV